MIKQPFIHVFIAIQSPVLLRALKLQMAVNPGMVVIGEAQDSLCALKGAVSTSPHVVLIHSELPGCVETISKLRLHLPSAGILVLAPDEHAFTAAAMLEAGATGFCLLSNGAKAIELAVKSVAAGAVWLDPSVRHRIMRYVAIGVAEAHRQNLPHTSRFDAVRANEQSN